MIPHHATVKDVASEDEESEEVETEATASIEGEDGSEGLESSLDVPNRDEKSADLRSSTIPPKIPGTDWDSGSSDQTSRKRKISGKKRSNQTPRYNANEPSIYELVAGMVYRNADGSTIQGAHRLKIFTSAIDHYFKRKHHKMHGNKDDGRVHWHDISENDQENLPSSELLTAIHQFVSNFFGGDEKYLGFMDETALLAMGILLEETMREELGETGFLALYGPDDDVEGSDDLEYNHAISDTSYDDDDDDEAEDIMSDLSGNSQDESSDPSAAEGLHGQNRHQEEPGQFVGKNKVTSKHQAVDKVKRTGKIDSAGDKNIELLDEGSDGKLHTGRGTSFGGKMIRDSDEVMEDAIDSTSDSEEGSSNDRPGVRGDRSKTRNIGSSGEDDDQSFEEEDDASAGNSAHTNDDSETSEGGGEDEDDEEEYLFRT